MNHTPNKNQLFAETIDFFALVENLPIGLYQVDNDGAFVYCNNEMARILGFNNEYDLIGKKFTDFDLHPGDRERLLNKMRKENIIKNEILYWKGKYGEDLCLSNSSQFVYDENGKEIGVRGVIMDVWHRRLFDNLIACVYKIGPDLQTIEKVNPAAAKILGYSRPEEMEGMNAVNLYKSPEDLEELKETLKKRGKVENYPIRVVKKDGEEIIVSVTASLIKDEKGEILGEEGTFTDITEIQLIRDILEEMPTSAYQLKIKEGRRVITYCNKAFADMFGYSSPQEIIDKKEVREFYADDNDVADFENALKEADAVGRPLLGKRLKVKNKDGHHFWVEKDSHLLKDHKGDIIGRQGTLRDATNTIRLEEMTKRREDVQRFAHRFMAPTHSIKSSSEALIEEVGRFMERQLFGRSLETFKSIKENPVETFRAINTLSRELLVNLKQLVALLEEEAPGDHKEDISNLKKNMDDLESFTIEEHIEDIIETREIHANLKELLSMISKRTVKNPEIEEKLNDALNCLEDIDNFYILYLAQIIINTSRIAFVDVEKLRSYLFGWDRKTPEEPFQYKSEDINDCIREVINIYQLYAKQKGISIEFEYTPLPKIMISKENVQKILHYLIDNAVKYSFKKKKGAQQGRYISVEVNREGDNIIIGIENYGVGILPEEIESKKIYEYGYRGRYSKDMNRTGSGIGLSEAKYLASKHNGDLVVTSVSAGDSRDKEDQNTPYITTVRVTLPISR